MLRAASVVFFALFLAPSQTSSGLRPDPPIRCGDCDDWNKPREPFKVFGNTYYVGVDGLSSLLITSDAGHILVDGALPQSAPLIDAGIRKLGFRTEDVKLIVNGHAHYDHAGGIAALQRLSGAQVAAGEAGVAALEAGNATADDPQFGFGRDANAFPRVAKVRGVRDGEVLSVGPLAIRAHATPGHTAGAVTWSWRSCEGARCLDVVYMDSLSAVSAPGFRFSANPSLVETFRSSLAKVARLPCDVFLAAHPFFGDLDGKLKRRAAGETPDPLIDPNACKVFAAEATKRLEARLADERK